MLISQFHKAGHLVSRYRKSIDGIPNLRMRLRHDIVPVGADKRLYNAPTAAEVAIIMPDTNGSIAQRDIVLDTTGSNKLIRIYERFLIC